MRCTDFKKLLSRFLEHELDPAQEISLRQHVDTCPSCARALASLQTIVTVMHGMDTVELPPRFEEQVNQKIDCPAWWERARRRLEAWWGTNMPYPAIAMGMSFVLALLLSHYLTAGSPFGKGRASGRQQLNVASRQMPRITEEEKQGLSLSGQTVGGRNDAVSAVRQSEPVPGTELVRSVSAPEQAGSSGMILPRRQLFGTQGDFSRMVMRDHPGAEGSGMVPVTTVSSSQSIPAAAPLVTQELERPQTVTLRAGDLIVAHRQQQWQMTAAIPLVQAVDQIMDALRQAGVKAIEPPAALSPDARRVTLTFVVHYGQLSPIIDSLTSLKSWGTFERLTPLPLPRPEAYMGVHGRPNPLVFQEQISVELVVAR